MEITATMVKELRDKTGAGMLKCKEALAECSGNLEEAIDYLRKKGLASADKKAGRATGQGLIEALVAPDLRSGVLVEINCETDFVAKTDVFRQFLRDTAKAALGAADPSVEAVAGLKLGDGHSIDETRKAIVTKTGENISLGRIMRVTIPPGKHGVVDSYIHNEGTLAVLLAVTCEHPDGARHDDLKAFAHEAALQIAAMKPRFVSRDSVPASTVEKEREIVLAQLKNDPKNASKPENILQKIVDGRMAKFFEEACLLEQTYVKDDSKKIQTLADELGKKLGGKVEVCCFLRWLVGQSDEPAPAA